MPCAGHHVNVTVKAPSGQHLQRLGVDFARSLPSRWRREGNFVVCSLCFTRDLQTGLTLICF